MILLFSLLGCRLFQREYICCQNNEVSVCYCPYFDTCDPPPYQAAPDGSCQIEDTGSYLDDSGACDTAGC